MTRFRALRTEAVGVFGAVAAPVAPGALVFGLAGFLAVGASLAYSLAQAGLQRLPQLNP
jgi:hypothetical protein